MSWYRLVFIFIMITISIQANKEFMAMNEDGLIIQAVWFEQNKSYENSRQVYAKLYDNTKSEIYLFKEVTASLLGNTHINESIKRLQSWDNLHPGTLESKRLLIPLYLTNNQLSLAKKEAEYLIEHSSKATDLELASNPFLYMGEFKKALTLLNKVYKKVPQEKILLRIVNIMDEYTNERTHAIQMLETHYRMGKKPSNAVLVKLLALYGKEKDIDGLLRTYKALYKRTKDRKVLVKIIDSYIYKRDINGAILFLEKHQVGDDLLYELYKNKKLFKKALRLIERKYKEDNDAKWLAEKGILLFEKAENKNDKEMISQVIDNFEKAIKLGVDDSIYLNYYGYTLIDKDVNVKKGMKIIKDALIQQPNNTYYLDSLAWGHYKIHECSKAYKLMKKVIEVEGLEEDEIVAHWRAIKQCK